MTGLLRLGPSAESSIETTHVSEEEREQLRTTLRAFFAKHLSPASVIAHLETEPGYEPGVLAAMVEQLALPALAVPERFGGMGFGWLELAVAVSESGRTPNGMPLLSGQFAAMTVLALGNEDGRSLVLPGLAAGTTRYTVAGLMQHHSLPREVHAEADPISGGPAWRLSGVARFVLDVPHADAFVVLAQSPTGPRLFLADRSAPGIVCTPLIAMDMTRPLAEVEFRCAPAQLLDSDGCTVDDIAAVRLSASLLLAAEQVGGARSALDTTLAYLGQRVQFGRVLGSFQVLKHRCADLHVAVCGAEAVLAAALDAAHRCADDSVLLAHLAAAVCSDVYLDVARAGIQLHGGIGFTWEHIAHVHLKRAKTSQLLLGTPAQHRTELASLIGVAAPALAGQPA